MDSSVNFYCGTSCNIDCEEIKRMRATVLVSPHLDDLVLGCGQFMGGRSDVFAVTVLAGTPSEGTMQTPYDRLCGFGTAEQAMAIRRDEDIAACAYLGATPLHLNFLDSQYGQPAKQSDIARVLADLIKQKDPESVIAPLGLVHPDHKLVSRAALDAALRFDIPIYLYEDLPSRVLYPETVPEALEEIRRTRKVKLELEFIGDGPLAKKMSALHCYKSQMQLPDFENEHTYLVPERFWLCKKI